MTDCELTRTRRRKKLNPKWLFWPKKGENEFSGHGVNTKSVDIGLNYLFVQFGRNR